MAKDKSYRIVLFANDDASRTKGLMYSEKLPEDHCALFSFPRVGDHSFWNDNVPYALSIAFCDSNHRVLAIRKMEAMSKDSCRANNPAVKYVVETSLGAMDEVGIGDRLMVDPDTMMLSFETSP